MADDANSACFPQKEIGDSQKAPWVAKIKLKIIRQKKYKSDYAFSNN